MDNKTNRMKKLGTLAAPPLIILIFMTYIFRKNGLYPFGTKAMSWCDMSQQVIPLLNHFKDILEGKSGFFFNMRDSGGMNFYGVFFFFLASPFSFLVKFVDKADMMMFANVLVALKMACSALTASVYFNHCHKKLDAPSAILLSVMYPLCGYTMMYYQNIIWLDMMYLFPLLIMSLDRIIKKRSSLMYAAVLTIMMAVNYYVCYMVVVFILLFTAVYAVSNFKKEGCAEVCREIFTGSLAAALMSAVVWLPSLIQYVSSGRGRTTLLESLSQSQFVTSYQTVFPMFFCTGFAFVLIIIDIVSGRKRSEGNKRMLFLLLLTLIPVFIEPINKMWHTGNYMSFPVRFGYMIIFIALVCSAYALESEHEYKNSIPMYFTAVITAAAAIYLAYRHTEQTRINNADSISRYAHTLWGDDYSLKLLFGIFCMLIIAYALIYIFYKKGLVFKNVFLLLSAAVFLIDATNGVMVYMVNPAEYNIDSNQGQSDIYKLENKINDDGFYRVKSENKIYNNNMIGALGYNGISHYTSLNDKDYMDTMKRLGYSGVWMETASVGGTRLTDALLSVRYSINGGVEGSEQIYSSDEGSLYRLPDYLPMGLLLEKGTLDGCEEIPQELTRTQIQQLISEKITGEQLVTVYEPDDQTAMYNGKFVFRNGSTITYSIDVDKNTSLYFDCHDEETNKLTEEIFDAFDVKLNNKIFNASFPENLHNGTLYLGDFKNETVNVQLVCKKDVACRSFGVFGIDTEALSSFCSFAEGVNLKEIKNGLSGNCTLVEPKTCFVSLPYNDGFTVKVNGKKIEYSRALSDFISFDLPSGSSEIEINFLPKGFAAGAVISVIGIALFTLAVAFRKKLKYSKQTDTAAKYIMLCVSLLAFAAVYIMPVIINIVVTKE